MIPPGFSSGHGLLALVDLSGWIAQAHAIGGVEGMVRLAVSRLAALLQRPAPACVAVAVDSFGGTWRHERTAAMDARDRYKAHRPPRPPEYFGQYRRIMQIVEHHRIPVLMAEGFEADDLIASAVIEADGLGLDVAIVTLDKDLQQMITPDGAAQRVIVWDGKDEVVDYAAVIERWGVPAEKLADVFAIVGDNADNVRGVPGIGPKGAADLVNAYGSLQNALNDVSPNAERIAEFEAAIKVHQRDFERARRRANQDALDTADTMRAAARETLKLGKLLAKLHEHREAVELAKELVTLDASAPATWDVEDLPLGGFNVDRLAKAYREAGLTKYAQAVRFAVKPALEDVVRREAAA